jgi:hypothetical protein
LIMGGGARGWHREIKVDDRFGRIARSHAGFSRQVAIERAAAELARIRPRLAAHIGEECRRLDAALVAARTGDENYRATIATAYSASQNLRDVAPSIGYSLLGFVAANLCTIIEAADAAQTACPVAIIDCYLDALRLVQTVPYRTKQPKELPELAAALSQTVQWMKSRAERAPIDQNQ